MACPDCFKGFGRTDKVATGPVETVYGLPTYVAQPALHPAKGVITIVPDAFGWKSNNNRLLADTYAFYGFRVYLPDFVEGIAVPIYFLDSIERFSSTSSLWDWICKPYDLFWLAYGMIPFAWRKLPKTSHPRATQFFEKLRTVPMQDDKGLNLRNEAHLIDAVFTAHPNTLSLPTDIDNVRKPVSIAVGDKDNWLSLEQIQQVEKTLKTLDREVPSMKNEVTVYPGASHGFSVRIDRHNTKQVEQSQQAEKQAVEWFENIVTLEGE